MIIRNAVKEDLNTIQNIYNHSIKHTTSIYNSEPYDLKQMTIWYDGKINNNFPILVCVTDKVVVGFASYDTFRKWPGYRFTIEYSIHVHHSFRRRGFASQLLEQLLTIAKEKGFHSMMAGIDASNMSSIKFHEKNGFKKVGHLSEVAYKFDRWLDLVFYQHML